MNAKSTYQMSKQGILTRMLTLVIKHTGVKQVDLLDPLLNLICESLAEEVYKVSNEIDSVEHRMLESVSNMLCPDNSLWAHPAHCILHASPHESTFLVTTSTPFVLKDKRYLPAEKNELNFTPVCNTFIHKGGVRYLIYAGLCYSIDHNLTKTLLFRSRNPEFIQKRSYWIALELDDAITKLDNLSFYFDFPGVSDKNEYLNQFQFAAWRLNGKKLSARRGLNQFDLPVSNEVVDLFNRFQATQILDENILKVYHKHYLTIEDEIILNHERKNLPEELINCFEEDLMQEFSSPLLWFEIELPQTFSESVTESLTTCINTFPVSNQYLCTKTVSLDEILKIIPLETGNGQSLLAVESVTDSKGRSYHELPFSDTQAEQYLTYTLRRGGYERYNKRDAREYLSNFTDLLSNYASFDSNTLDDDSKENISKQVQGLLKHMNKKMADLTDRLEVQSYILIDRIWDSEVFFTQYWLTDCEWANKIKQGAYFEISGSEELPIDEVSVFSLSPTIGGRRAPESADRQGLRRKSLTRKTILVTDRDIISFCKEELGSLVENIEIRNGIVEVGSLNSAFVRTTDVYLTPNQNESSSLNDDDLIFLTDLLVKNSPATFNFRVFINNDK